MTHLARYGAVLAALTSLGLWAEPAHARQPEPQAAYRLELELDLPIVLLGGGVASSFFVLREVPGVPCAPSCDRSRINALDRPFAGRNDSAWDSVGNVATATTMALPLIAVLADEGLWRGLNDDLVVAEAALMSSALQVPISYAVARPRPRVYSEDATRGARTDANTARSFFSGHVANVVAVSFAGLRTFQRLGNPTAGWIVFGAGMAGSTLVGASRMLSGAHFPSDVLVGAAVGAGFGIALPALHASGARLMPYRDSESESSGVLLSGRF